MEPAVGVDGFVGGLGVVEVPTHDVVAPHHDLPWLPTGHLDAVDVDDPHVDVGDGPARRPGDHLGGVPAAAHRHRPGGLGEAVGGEHGLDAQIGPEAPDHLDGHDRGAGHHQAQRSEVEALPVGVVEDGLEDGRRAGQHGDPLLVDAPDHPVDVEHRLGHHGGPGHQAGQDPRLVPEGVEERVDDQVAVALVQADDLGPGGKGPQGLTVGGHRPLGVAGGPRGEDEVGEVAGGDRGGPTGGHVGGAQASLTQEDLPLDDRVALGGRPPRRAVTGAQHDHPLEVGHLGAGSHRLVEQPRVVVAEEPLHGEEHPRPRLGQDVRRLRSLEPGVEGHQEGARPHRPEGGDDPLGAVGRPDRHPVAAVDPVGHDGPGGGRHLVGQLVEGQPGGGPAGPVRVDQCLGAAEARRGILHQSGDGPPLEVPAGIGDVRSGI